MENQNYDCLIYMRMIRIEFTLPENLVMSFMKAFKRDFLKPKKDLAMISSRLIEFYEHPNGWHITVNVGEREEGSFYDFLRGFCAKNQISFRDDQKKSA